MTVQQKIVGDFENILKICSSQGFLKMESLGGEIPFWIAPYQIEHQELVDNEIENLLHKLSQNGQNPLVIDLFELMCYIVKTHIGLETMFGIQEKKKPEKFMRALKSVVDIQDAFVPEISKKLQEAEYDMLLIKGVGSVYPVIRSHAILNNLQSTVTEIPTLMFFPGEYSGQSLNLFGRLKDDNYYRAFNINQFKH